MEHIFQMFHFTTVFTEKNQNLSPHNSQAAGIVAFSQPAISTADFTHKHFQEPKTNYSPYAEVFHSIPTELQFDLSLMVCLATR